MTVTHFEQPPQGQVWPKSKYFCTHQIDHDKTNILSTEKVQKVHSRPKLWGFEKGCGKIGQNALPVTLFKQLPKAKIGPKFKTFCAHQIANDQTIVLRPENPQKVNSRPKLLALEKKL